MKRILIILVLVTSFISCNNVDKKNPIINGVRKEKNGELLVRYNKKSDVVEQYAYGKIKYFYAHDTLISKDINYFDENNNISKTERYENGKITSTSQYKTLKNGMIKESMRGDNKIVYYYNENHTIKNIKDKQGESIFTYHEDGRIDKISYKSGYSVFQYDKDNKYIGEKSYDKKGVLNFEIEIKYDVEGFISYLDMFIINGEEREFYGKIVFEYSKDKK